MKRSMKIVIQVFALCIISIVQTNNGFADDSWTLEWYDEFEYDGVPYNSKWAVIHYDNE